MKFTKMHGAGNDFIIVENLSGELDGVDLSELAPRLCSRRTGIGADGMMVVIPAKSGGDYGMLFYNSDGSLGEMCGNGARCIARYGHDRGLAGAEPVVETTAGIVRGRRIDSSRYEVRLNDPSVIDLRRSVSVKSGSFVCAYIELGNPGIPHAVVIMPGLDSFDRQSLFQTGRELRYAKEFPKGANVTFVKSLGADKLSALTYERGVEDFTLACGTGSGATVAALTLFGLVSGRNVSVSMPGGELCISLTKEGETVKDIMLTGPTCMVCTGETEL